MSRHVIDADSHVMEPRDLWLTRLEPEYRDRAIRITEVNGIETLIIGEQVILGGVLAALGGIETDRAKLFSGTMRYEDGCPRASYDPDARMALYDDWGLTGGLLFPTIGILPYEMNDIELGTAYCRAYNSWVADHAAATGGRAIPAVTLNLRDVEGAAAELDRCLELGFKTVFLAPELIDRRRPSDPLFDPIWRRCEEAGVTVCLHVVVRFGGAGLPYEPWHFTGAGTLFGFALNSPGQIIPTLTGMVVDGLFDRFPQLKVLCVEAGCGWAAHLMDRLDGKYETVGKLTTSLELEPAEYLKRNVWYVAEPGERTIGAMLDLVGEDRILWGSDHPHIDATMEARANIEASLAGLKPEQRAAVLGGNAAALLGLS